MTDEIPRIPPDCPWARWYDAYMGFLGDDQQTLAREGMDWLILLLQKNRDYGSTIWDSPCLAPHLPAKTAILVRMGDKIDRLKSLMEKGNPEVAESVDDTIRDLGAYCLLYLTAVKRQEKNTGPDGFREAVGCAPSVPGSISAEEAVRRGR